MLDPAVLIGDGPRGGRRPHSEPGATMTDPHRLPHHLQVTPAELDDHAGVIDRVAAAVDAVGAGLDPVPGPDAVTALAVTGSGAATLRTALTDEHGRLGAEAERYRVTAAEYRAADTAAAELLGQAGPR